nr:PEP-CTERM/exosortase system-associated acyltransferase [Govania unica]
MLERVYRLRYDVYCVANQFEDRAHQIAGYEQDKYDQYSVHSLLMDSESGAELGTVRLILPNDEVSLPTLQVSPTVAEAAGLLFPQATTAEASRFLRAVDVSGSASGQRESARETLALMTAIVQMCASQGMTHVLALVTKPMLRFLNRFALAFKPIGEPVEFHGLRYAAILDLTTDLSVVAAERPDVWRTLTADGLYYNSLHPDL